MKKWLIAIPVTLLLLYVLLRIIIPLVSPKPTNLGLQDNKQLLECPDSPNCVCTFEDSTDEEHYIKPIVFKGTAEEAMKKVDEIIAAMPRNTVIESEGNYRYFENRTFMWRFIDDVEIYFDEATGLIHFRSASRLGRSDFGKNRQRMEEFRDKFK